MKVLPLCENSKSQPLEYNNKTDLPVALVNYAPLLWLFSETIKGNRAISEVSGKELSTITEVDCWLFWKISSKVSVCLGEHKPLKHEGLPVRAANPPHLKTHKEISLVIKYLPSMSFPIRFVSPTGKRIAVTDRPTKSQRVIYQPEGKAVCYNRSV